MPDFMVLLPLMVLFLGAIISAAEPKLPKPVERWLSTGILALALAATLLNAAPSSHQFEISDWDAAALAITLRLDGSTLVLLVAILVPLIALQLVSAQDTMDAFTFFVLTSSLLLMSAGNLNTVFFAWIFLDLALFAWREARRIPHDAAMRALILGQLAGLALFAGAIFIDAKQTQTGGILVALAFWARLGLYPFHWIYPNADLQTLELATIRGASLAAGASLWLRWSELSTTVLGGWVGLLAAIAFVAIVVRSVSERQALDKIAANTSNAMAFVPLAVAFSGGAAMTLALWIALGVFFALAMFELALGWQSDMQVRWSRLFFSAGIFAVVGVPLSPAFLGRVGVYVSLIDGGQWFILATALIGTTLLPSSLWRIGANLMGAELREPTRRELAGLQLLGLTFLVYSFGAATLAAVTGDSADRALDLVIRTDNLLGVASAFLVLLASVGISFFLARAGLSYRPQNASSVLWMSRLLELDWLARWLTHFGEGVSALARSLAALAEENPTVWILFAALWIAIFILTSR